MVVGSIFRVCVILMGLWGMTASAKPIEKAQKIVSSYLMPEDHPIKAELDACFKKSRVTFNLESLKKAGFNRSFPRKYTRLIVTKHSKFPGYIFKLYLDVQRYHSDEFEFVQWAARVEGGIKIREYIQAAGTEELFCVPDAWIYQLPDKPKCPEGYIPKNYILVEQEMNLISSEENEQLWKSDEIAKETLENLFCMIADIGLEDCLKPDNLPFTEEGRIAFIDTESYGKKVKFKHLIPFLSESNQDYWKHLINNY